MKRKKVNLEGIPPLLTFASVKQKCLTITGASVLKLLQEHKTQATIAKQLGTSRQMVNYHVKKLTRLGIITRYQYARNVKQKCLTTAGGVANAPFDVRFRSLKWALTQPVKLPYDEEHTTSGLTQRTWHIRNCLVRHNAGARGAASLEIEAGYTGGNSKDACNHAHDAKAISLFNWLCQHYPELQASAGAFIVNRPGELQIAALQPLAQAVLQDRGGGVVKLGDPPVVKFDQSRGFPEAQALFENIATKDELQAIRNDLSETTLALKELTATLKELLGNVQKPQEPPKDMHR